MTDSLPSTFRRRATLLGLTLPLALALAGSCQPDPNFLRECTASADCGTDLECLCGTCTRRCSSTECDGLGPGARCVPLDPAAAARACGSSVPPAVCTSACSSDADCAAFGAKRCVSGACLGSTPLPDAGADVSTPDGSDASTPDSDAAGDTSSDALTPDVAGDAGMDSGVTFCGKPVLPGEIRTLVLPGSNAGHLFLEGQHVYFLSEQSQCARGCSSTGQLRRVPICGGSIEDVSQPFLRSGTTLVPSLHRLAFGGGHAYAISAALVRVNVQTKAQSTLAISADCAADVAANATHVYVYDRCGQQILRAAHNEVLLARFAQAGDGNHMALGPRNLYFELGNDVRVQALDASASQPFYAAGSRLVDLSADDRAVIVAHHAASDAATVTRVPVAGGAAQGLGTAFLSTAASSGMRAAETTVVQSGKVYFRQLGPQNVSQVTRVGSDGLGATGVLRRTTTDIAADGERMFWSEGGGVFTALPEPPLGTKPPTDFPPTWTNRYEEPQTQNRFYYMNLLPDGAMAVLGYSVGGINGERAVLYKIRSDGTRDFTKEFTIQGGTQPACLAVDGSGTITAAVDEFFSGSLAIHRYGSSGTELPSFSEPGMATGSAECTADAAGNLYFAFGGSLFAKKNGSGSDIWRQGSVTAGSLSPAELTAVADGVIFVGQLHGSIDLGGKSYTGGDASSIIAKLAANGGFAWSQLVNGGVVDRVAADSAGKIVAVGEMPENATAVAIGSQQFAPPRPYERFSFLAWFGADGSFERLRFYDGSGGGDIAFAPNGNLYLIAGGSTRPFAFAPDTLGYYESFAELTPSGDLLRIHNLSPHLLPAAPDGFYLLQSPRVAVRPGQVAITGTLYPWQGFPPGVFVPSDPNLVSLVQGFAARFNP